MNLTTKQKFILGLIIKANPDGPIDLDQVIERVPYVTSKQSMHFSIRALVNKGLVEKGPTEVRRERARRLLVPTPLGHHWATLLCPKPVPQHVSEVLTDEELEFLSKECGLS